MPRHPVMVRQVCPLLPQDPQEAPDLLLSAEFIWREEGILELSYNIRPAQRYGDLLDLALPSSEPKFDLTSGQRLDDLWKHSCFEAFLGLPGSEKYWELNLSPSGDWNLYSFETYRRGGKTSREATSPLVRVRRKRRDFRCDVILNLRPWWPVEALPELGLTMVLEDNKGRLSYWALSHPGEVADFHDRRSFLIC